MISMKESFRNLTEMLGLGAEIARKLVDGNPRKAIDERCGVTKE
jgi:hypothetical protein